MKKKYSRKVFLIFFIAMNFSSTLLSAQLVRLLNGFDNYIGTTGSVPSGWRITWNSTTPPSYYTSVGNYGATSPSYSFGITQDTLISPYFQSGDVLWFWCKSQGAPFSVQNSLKILVSDDSSSWNVLQNVDSLSASGVTMAFNIPCSAHYVMFVYNKVNGNLAFDDVKVTMTDYSPTAIFSATLNNICEGDSACFADMSTISGCDSIASRIWNFGDGTPLDSSQNPCHIFSQTGNYNVWLHVTTTNGNSDSSYLTISIYPRPLAQFTSNNVSGTLIDFTDMSTITSSSIISWYWSFGDSTFSTLQNPTHQYFSIGAYYACLTVTSINGCADSICDSVFVIGAAIPDYEVQSGIYIGPIPARNQVTLFSNHLRIEEIGFYDLLGQKIISEKQKEQSHGNVTVDVSKLTPGIYFLKLIVHKKPITLKVIIAN
ncbi:MAG: PKD domain-containing protein [Bacteroidia bacterium]|nr:PKD domain-containing protein [Bacteroidia bacterium]